MVHLVDDKAEPWKISNNIYIKITEKKRCTPREERYNMEILDTHVSRRKCKTYWELSLLSGRIN